MVLLFLLVEHDLCKGRNSPPALSTGDATNFLLPTPSLLVDLPREHSILGTKEWKYDSTLSGENTRIFRRTLQEATSAAG